jgi:hypothetical protein
MVMLVVLGATAMGAPRGFLFLSVSAIKPYVGFGDVDHIIKGLMALLSV